MVKLKFHCNFCGKEIPRLVERKVHINIEQPLATHFFCSRDCKAAWIREIKRMQKNPELYKASWFHAKINK